MKNAKQIEIQVGDYVVLAWVCPKDGETFEQARRRTGIEAAKSVLYQTGAADLCHKLAE